MHLLSGVRIGEHKFNLLDRTHLDVTVHSDNPVYFNKPSLWRTYADSLLELYMLRRNLRDGTYEVCDLLHNEWFKISTKPERFDRLAALLDPQQEETLAWTRSDDNRLSRDRQKLGWLLKRFDRLLEYVHSDVCNRNLCWST